MFDGEAWITFNIVDLNELKNEIQVAITNRGKITAEKITSMIGQR